jgi:lipopolysaccharide biosynthesis protein
MMAAVSILLAGCATISLYSEAAYQQTINLKVDTLYLMDKAAEPYTEHQDEVLSLMHMIDKAYEYALGRPKNETSAKQWAVLRNPDGNLVGGFMRTWKEKGQLSKTFIDEAKGVVGDAFDTISALESGKPKAKDSIIGGGH